jgi:hypothetical protein
MLGRLAIFWFSYKFDERGWSGAFYKIYDGWVPSYMMFEMNLIEGKEWENIWINS